VESAAAYGGRQASENSLHECSTLEISPTNARSAKRDREIPVVVSDARHKAVSSMKEAPSVPRS